MRYTYIKNGNAVEQVRRILQGSGDPGGPDAFIGDFIHAHAADAILVLCRSTRRERLVGQSLVAESYSARGGRLSSLSRWWAAIRVGVAILRWRPERVLCGCTAELLWISLLAAKLLRVPIVCSRHSGLAARKGLGRLISALDALSIQACDAVVCHGPFLAQQVREIGVAAEKIHQFDVDLRRFVELRPPSQPVDLFEPGALVVMYVGRIQVNKGVLDLLEAFAACARDGHDVARLVYIGIGKDEDALKAAVDRNKLGARVRLLGAVAHERLPVLMRDACVIVAPTQPELVEGRCMVVLEAMALGVPVIAPDFAAFPYAIRDDVDGMLYTPGSVAALSASLARMLSDPALRDRLRKGAGLSGQRLLVDPPRFASAVEAAFAHSCLFSHKIRQE